MSLTELLPEVRDLPRADRVKLVRLIADELFLSEELGIKSGESYPISTPLETHEAAAILARVLETGEADG